MNGWRRAFDIAIVAILGLFLIACLFVHPTADDFIYAASARAGVWEAWQHEYAGWNGRYTSNLFVLATPLLFGLAAYRAAAAAMLVSTLGAMYLVVRVWAEDALSRREALTCAGVLCALYFSQVPSIGDALYWYTSAATYELWIVPALVHLALVIRSVRRSEGPGTDRLSVAIAAVLLAAVAGFNEVIMLIAAAFYGVWLIAALVGRAPGRGVAWTMFATAVVSGSLVLLSPGNTVRQAMYSGTHHQPLRSLGMTALQTLRFGAEWLSSGALLAASMLFVPIAAGWLRRSPQNPDLARSCLRIAIAGLVLVVPIAVFPAYWETGTLGQHRTIDVAFMVFLLLWFLAITTWLATKGARADALERLSGDAVRPLAILLVLTLAFTHNSYLVGSDLVAGRLRAFDGEMEARNAALRACARTRQPVCALDPIQVQPVSFSFLDLSPNPAHWMNAAYARYFAVPTVTLKDVRNTDVRN